MEEVHKTPQLPVQLARRRLGTVGCGVDDQVLLLQELMCSEH